jgi:hypothetical protein
MKILEIRLSVPDSVSASDLQDLGDEMQQSLPVDCEQNGMEVHNVTYEVRPEAKQTITVALDLQPKQRRYNPVEHHGTRRYHALRHFFEDIGYKVLKISAILLICVAGSRGQQVRSTIEAPKAKPVIASHKFDKRVFFTGIGLLAAAKTADAVTTRQVLDRGGYELNPVYGRHPSPARQAGINAAFFIGQSALFYLTERNRHAWVRWTGRVWFGAVIVNHTQLAVCNSGINVHSSASTACRNFMPGL